MSNIIGCLIVDAALAAFEEPLIDTVYCSYRSDSSTEALVALAKTTLES